MIAFRYTSPQDFIKPYSPTKPTEEVINKFSQDIEKFLGKALDQDTEEFQKNKINNLLREVYKYDCNTKGQIDSVIYVENEAQVLIETKSLTNKAEFPKDTPLSKALCEAVLYFLREIKSNNSIKHIILCNPCEFYIFDARNFNIFSEDSQIKKFYKNCDGKEGTNTSTKKFYESLEEYLRSNKFSEQLSYTYFSLNKELSTEELSVIYQLLSPQVLLKVRKTLDANTLNKDFYEELLYILGLEEKGEGGKNKGKILIKPSSTPHTLSSEISRQYGLDEEPIFTLITAWNNRILFLRLLESMLLSFKHIDKPFLDISIIKDFKTLQNLFFEVLAKKSEERSPLLPKEFLSIPYLNSSLFDKIPLEEKNNIGGLDSYEIPLFSRSILKERYKDKNKPSLLEYLFEFLHAYDFTTTPKDIEEGVKKNHDKLINSAVLGLVFEKLNGYKEGSFYTPSFITTYMCKESITQAVIDKFNDTYHWEAQSLQDIIYFARGDRIKRDTLLSTLLSIRICDPAVGSGHFLVSALNEIIFIANSLGLLESLPLTMTLEIDNDEIVIKQENEVFAYQKPTSPNEPSHQIQKEIFNLKKSIIENCLFGVDINPNSCEITKLRLWIELLKYSYYIFDKKGKNSNALETLPNIDINIKCGNSLISYFPFDSYFKVGLSKSVSQNLKSSIKKYKKSVFAYKNGAGDKNEILDEIDEIKSLLASHLVEISPQQKRLTKKLKDFIHDYGDKMFDIHDELGFRAIKTARELPQRMEIIEPAPMDRKGEKLLEEIETLHQELKELESGDGFEWRFEFPEVLDDDGDFLGFDCVIGNPPYIRHENIKELKPKLQKNYEIFCGTSDIYTYFFERGLHLLKERGLLSFITSNKWTRAGYGQALRQMILSKTIFRDYIDFNGEQIFESATVDTSITTLIHSKPQDNHSINYLVCDEISKLSSRNFQSIPIDSLSTDGFSFSSQSTLAIKAKIEELGTPLKEWDISINYGIKTGYNDAFIITTEKREEILKACKTKKEREDTSKLIRKILRGRDIKRYEAQWAGLWLINTHNGYTISKNEIGSNGGNKKTPQKIPPINIKDYPALKKHLDSYRKEILARADQGNTPYNLRNCVYLEQFEREKIIYPNMTKFRPFILDKHNFVVNQKCFIITAQSNKTLAFLTGILNSWVFDFAFAEKFPNLLGGTLELSKVFFEKLPIPKITKSNQAIANKITSLVEKILEKKEQNPQADTQKLEAQIDSLVYKLYSLTDEEIKIIENSK